MIFKTMYLFMKINSRFVLYINPTQTLITWIILIQASTSGYPAKITSVLVKPANFHPGLPKIIKEPSHG